MATSALSDLYFEEVWCSAWSAHQHNPTAVIALVCDDRTFDGIKNSYRFKALELFKEVIPVKLDETMSNLQRSRWLKTQLRSIVKGDFLYLGSGTVVIDDLSEIDGNENSTAMVLDMHETINLSPIDLNYAYIQSSIFLHDGVPSSYAKGNISTSK